MEEIRENITPPKNKTIEIIHKEPEIEPIVIDLREYKPKFNEIQAYQMKEASTVHCADNKKLLGNAGDYYVQLDKVQEIILPAEIFKKLFIYKPEK
jgi:hypothetical protein